MKNDFETKLNAPFIPLDAGNSDRQVAQDSDRGVRGRRQLGLQQGDGPRVLQVLHLGDCASYHQVRRISASYHQVRRISFLFLEILKLF